MNSTTTTPSTNANAQSDTPAEDAVTVYNKTPWGSSYRTGRVYPTHQRESGFVTKWTRDRAEIAENAQQSWDLLERPPGYPDQIRVYGPLARNLMTLPAFRD